MEGKGVGVEEGLEFQGFLNRRQKINFTKSEYVISKAKGKILTTLLNGMLQHRFKIFKLIVTIISKKIMPIIITIIIFSRDAPL